jgi:KDO2-lipid IV(A) lauroyltransferase
MMPRGLGLPLFSFLGTLVFYISDKERRRTIEHLEFIYGKEWDERKIKRTALAVFKNSGMNLFDGVHLACLTDDKLNKIVTHDSFEEVKNAYAKGKGVVAITAHVGCFEMQLHLYSRKGFKCFAIGRKFENEMVDDVVRKMRSGPDMEYMDKSENPRNVIRSLQKGKMMGVLVDQDTKVEGVFAGFLGHESFTPSGPIRLAMKLDLPAFVGITARMPGNKHHLFITPPLTLDNTGNFEADLISNVQKVNDIISEYIHKFPEQWVWMHKRWATKQKRNV